MASRAIKISLTLNGSIVFPDGFIEDYTDPVSWGKMGVTDELDACSMTVRQFHNLADLEVGEIGHRNGKSWQWSTVIEA